jgi:hypothetical protein
VPFWHAQLWVRAPAVRLGDVVVATPPDRDALLDVTQRGGEVRVLLDGRLVADAAPAGDPARTALDLLSGDAVDGEILAIALTTWRRDADVRGLAAGETAVVPWGGSLPVEAVAAVSGPAVVRMLAGDDCVAESAVVPGDLPVLVRLRTTRSVDRLEVVAGAEPVVVSDVVLTARPRVEAVDVDLAGLEVPAPRTGVA